MFLMQSTLLVVYLTLPLLLPTLLYYCTIPKPLSSTTTSLPVENIHKKKIYIKLKIICMAVGDMKCILNEIHLVSFRFVFYFYLYFLHENRIFNCRVNSRKQEKKLQACTHCIFIYLYTQYHTIHYSSFPPFNGKVINYTFPTNFPPNI